MSDFEKDIMRGEFRGDFTRDTFQPEKTYSRVLMQQGRVQVDADWNEQVSIQLHHLRNIGRDIGGEHWGPLTGNGFEIGSKANGTSDFTISPGHYYVDGILCEAGVDVSYINQPNYPLPDNEKLESLKGSYLVYLDVWERHISYVEDDAIREIALNGPDTATRAKIIWQVKVISDPRKVGNDANNDLKSDYSAFLKAISAIIKPGTGRLQAKAKDKTKTETEPCLVEPDSKYRGNENQLYRVEVHLGSNNSVTKQATFKWSRENAAVIFPILETPNISNGTTTLTLEHLGRDARFSLKHDDWVEIVYDDYILQNRSENLLQVLTIDYDDIKVTLKGIPSSTPEEFVNKHPYLRRWDQKTGDANGIVVQESPDATPVWIDLEDGVQVRFPEANPNPNQLQNSYQSGDYWLIPARTIKGDVEWPSDDKGEPKALLSHGVIHHYAPLAMIDINTENTQLSQDLRRILKAIW